MTSACYRFTLVAVVLAFAAIGSGCRQQANHATAETDAAPNPEESFELIMETFRRDIDIPVGFVLREGGGHTMMTGKNEVSYELIAPVSEGDRYRAIVTVDSQSRYSIQRATDGVDEGEESDEADDNSGNRGSDFLADSFDSGGLEIYDSDLISAPGAGSRKRRPSKAADRLEPTVLPQRDTHVREFELVYEDDRWVLVTKPDPDTEQAIQNAFDRALKMQG